MENVLEKKKHAGGRPKGSIAKSTAIAIKIREVLARKLYARISPIADAQLDAALGIQTEHYDKKSGDLYYKDPGPNTLAFKNILEQVVGRATDKVELSGRDGKPLIIKLDR